MNRFIWLLCVLIALSSLSTLYAGSCCAIGVYKILATKEIRVKIFPNLASKAEAEAAAFDFVVGDTWTKNGPTYDLIRSLEECNGYVAKAYYITEQGKEFYGIGKGKYLTEAFGNALSDLFSDDGRWDQDRAPFPGKERKLHFKWGWSENVQLWNEYRLTSRIRRYIDINNIKITYNPGEKIGSAYCRVHLESETTRPPQTSQPQQGRPSLPQLAGDWQDLTRKCNVFINKKVEEPNKYYGYFQFSDGSWESPREAGKHCFWLFTQPMRYKRDSEGTYSVHRGESRSPHNPFTKHINTVFHVYADKIKAQHIRLGRTVFVIKRGRR